MSLSYFPSNNTLTIGMLKVSQEISFRGFTFLCQARNLKAKDINGKSGEIFVSKYVWLPCSCSDPYVKVWLMFGEKRVEKKKTPVYKCNLNPTFNQVRQIQYSYCFYRYCSDF